ncbi:response regulator transcription factor [Sphingobacterium daejeonense]|uniref:response regulator transcription factor n=1 Tax=Sphingobacterium daejeonense TaxID=371142 RepID=UPI0010C27880|nr:response regulator transcription factor [Sphingobacterium daejeonense]VTQ06714.1 Mycobacterial persistence regulator A [Sphingobacterium daejeonense]
MELLLVEDESSVISLIQRGLKYEDFQITVAMDGLSGLKIASSKKFDLIILDVMLPNMNGLDVCRQIRKFDTDVPILILTALDQTEDVVEAFNRDADDYMTKPFILEELKARIHRQLRKVSNNNSTQHLIQLDDLILDRASKSVSRNGKAIILTATEFRLLEYMMVNRNKVISRMDILEAVWEMDVSMNTNVVDVYVNYLRKKIDKNFENKLIHTVIGMGYVMRNEN